MKIQTKVERNECPNNIERDSFSSKIDECGVSNISGLKTANSSQRVKTTAPPNRGGRGNKRKRKKKAKLAAEQSVSLNETKQQEKSESSV